MVSGTGRNGHARELRQASCPGKASACDKPIAAIETGVPTLVEARPSVVGSVVDKRAWTAWPSAMVAETTTREPIPSGWVRVPTSLLGSAAWSGNGGRLAAVVAPGARQHAFLRKLARRGLDTQSPGALFCSGVNT